MISLLCLHTSWFLSRKFQLFKHTYMFLWIPRKREIYHSCVPNDSLFQIRNHMLFYFLCFKGRSIWEFGLVWYKDLLETKSTKVYSKMLLMKSSANSFIFLPVFYLIIMWTMKAPKNFGKIYILKIWELVFLRSCQNSLLWNSHKMIHFQAWKNKDFNQYFVVAFDPIKIFTH